MVRYYLLKNFFWWVYVYLELLWKLLKRIIFADAFMLILRSFQSWSWLKFLYFRYKISLSEIFLNFNFMAATIILWKSHSWYMKRLFRYVVIAYNTLNKWLIHFSKTVFYFVVFWNDLWCYSFPSYVQCLTHTSNIWSPFGKHSRSNDC